MLFIPLGIVVIDRIVINRSVRLCGTLLYQKNEIIGVKQKTAHTGVQSEREVYT